MRKFVLFFHWSLLQVIAEFPQRDQKFVFCVCFEWISLSRFFSILCFSHFLLPPLRLIGSECHCLEIFIRKIYFRFFSDAENRINCGRPSAWQSMTRVSTNADLVAKPQVQCIASYEESRTKKFQKFDRNKISMHNVSVFVLWKFGLLHFVVHLSLVHKRCKLRKWQLNSKDHCLICAIVELKSLW